ncbi:hypothetical protein AKI39_03135 [Bordetella sp. H567]|uniref:phage tail tape measure protein n=1 Tax=Bordetella sp. H567 TaxID=1697043 RepID=UPI00081C3E55|nr:hypothetical protein [Bordetella sp. H567]AOB29899.1 hypothetical protein AKI39_03135 [Bordetella sp. H567]
MDKTLQLRVITAIQDKLSGPLKKIIGASTGTAQALQDLRSRLKGLEDTQRQVGKFRDLSKGLSTTRGDLQATQDRIRGLAAEMKGAGTPTRAMQRDFDRAVVSAGKLKEQASQQAQQLQVMRDRLGAAGVSTSSLAQHEQDLRSRITATTAAMSKQVEQMDAVTARQKAMSAARDKLHAAQGTAANMAIAGYAARSAGMHGLHGLEGSLEQSKDFEREAVRIKALGLGDHATEDAAKYARAMKQYGTSTTDNIVLMRDALTIFADEHHAQMAMPTLAKMKFANEAMYGSGEAKANEEAFMNMLKVIELRGGAKDQASFDREANMVQKVLSATGGRVGGDQWRDFIQRGGVAAKQLRNDAFYYQMEPLIQEMGGHAVGTGLMSAYSNLYQGKTTVRAVSELMKYGLVNPKMVEYTKIGTVKRVAPGALTGGELFKASPLEWVEQVLLPKLAAKGVTDPGAINDAISSMITNRTGANLFTTLVMQAQQIHKNERLNKGAADIDQSVSLGKTLTQGREVEVLARWRDLQLELGEKISPLYNGVLRITAAATEKVTDFMQKHATTATVLVSALTVLAGLMVAGGTLTIGLAAVIGPLAIVRFGLTTLGVQGGLGARALSLLADGFRLAGSAIMFVGRTMLLNPIGLTITAIALAAALIYEYWTPLKAFFSDLWAKVASTFENAVQAVSGAAQRIWDGAVSVFGSMWASITGIFNGGVTGLGYALMNWNPLQLLYDVISGALATLGIQLPAKFTEFGAMLMTGLISGITGMAGAVKDSIVGMGDDVVGWFKDKLGIRSPSRVFIGLGEFVSQGAAIGIARQQPLAVDAARALAGAIAVSGALAAPAALAFEPTGSDGQPLSFDTRAPIAAAAGGRQIVIQGDTITIQLSPAGGADTEDLAQQIGRILDQRDRMKAARIRSQLSDVA